MAVTLRGYGTGISELGDGLLWGEAKTLLEEAAADGGTALGAELAGWAYPASMVQLITLSAQIGDSKVFRKVAPWALDNPRRRKQNQATPDEIAAAQAELEAEFVFT